ncbi:Alpha/Beta hydrolase protein [Biscogniauxia marginata]|nr:Alpha/Beta hydrolase protein [Biscogniauxia marginata]
MAAEPREPEGVLKEIKTFDNDLFFITEILFECPIDYEKPKDKDNSIILSFKLVQGDKTAKTTAGLTISQHKLLVYLCGGPGDSNSPARMPELNRFFLERDYWILYPDYRGTGDSSSKEIIHSLGKTDMPRALYILKHLGQTNIVRDLEAVRITLHQKADKWSICAQSYGGWILYSYLSFSYAGLRRIYNNAGLTPIHYDATRVHQQLFRNIIKRNETYYALYPDDIHRVKHIALWLARQNDGKGIKLPAWGNLTAKQFLCLGRNLGTEAKFTQLNKLYEKMYRDIGSEDESESLTDETIELYKATDSWRFNKRPLYAILNESQYLRNTDDVTKWVAQRVASEPEFVPYFWWVNCPDEELGKGFLGREKLYLSGEMIYPFFFDNYEALKPLKAVAMEFANCKLEEPSYDLEQIKENKVPITAVHGSKDVVVDPGLAEATWKNTGSIKVKEVEGLEHGAIRSDTALVLKTHLELGEFE